MISAPAPRLPRWSPLILILAGLGRVPPSLHAQAVDPPPRDTVPTRPLPLGIGGPLEGIAQILADNEPRPRAYRFGISPFQDWQEWKDGFFERTGIAFNLNYTALYTNASHGIEEGDPTWAASGIIDLAGTWTPVGRHSGNSGTLLVKLNQRHAIGSDRTPMFLGLDTGYYGLPGIGFRRYALRMLEVNWTQVLGAGRGGFAMGKVDPVNYFNYHRLIVPWTHFLGLGSLVTGTVNWPDPGWGIVGGARLTESFYAGAALTDARGDVYGDGDFLYGGNQFFNGKFFSALEVGWTPTQSERFDRRVGLLFWHTPEYEEDGSGTTSAEASGWALSANWEFQDRWIPFARLAASNGEGVSTLYERDVQVGLGRRFRNYDMIGASASWARPNLDEARSQYTAEVFWRIVFTQHLEISPDLQLILNPALNPSRSWMTYFGIRTRATF